MEERLRWGGEEYGLHGPTTARDTFAMGQNEHSG